jgi:hypothetical protein
MKSYNEFREFTEGSLDQFMAIGKEIDNIQTGIYALIDRVKGMATTDTGRQLAAHLEAAHQAIMPAKQMWGQMRTQIPQANTMQQPYSQQQSAMPANMGKPGFNRPTSPGFWK